MAAQWGNVLYWMATIIATLLVAWVVWSYVYNSSRGEPIIQILPLLLAGLIWLVGWFCRRLLTER
jgi:hypothetical protein